MTPLFGLIAWAGYAIGSYGWVLLKGYDIQLAAWLNPVHPFEWASNPGMVPAGQVFPGGGGGAGEGSLGPVRPAGAGEGGGGPVKPSG